VSKPTAMEDEVCLIITAQYICTSLK